MPVGVSGGDVGKKGRFPPISAAASHGSVMAASVAAEESCKDNKHKESIAEMCPDGVIPHSCQECISSLLDAITEFSSEVS